MKNNLQKVFKVKFLMLTAAVMVMFFSQCKKDSSSESVKPVAVSSATTAKNLSVASTKKDTICCAVKTAAKPATTTTSKKDTICCAVSSFVSAKKDTICCAVKAATTTTTTAKKDTICCAVNK